MTFGAALREARREAGISQRELADRTALDFSYISKLENNRIPPPAADTLVKICDALGIPSERLLSLTGKLPSDVQEAVGASQAAQEFLRVAERLRLTDEEWRQLQVQARRLRGDP